MENKTELPKITIASIRKALQPREYDWWQGSLGRAIYPALATVILSIASLALGSPLTSLVGDKFLTVVIAPLALISLFFLNQASTTRRGIMSSTEGLRGPASFIRSYFKMLIREGEGDAKKKEKGENIKQAFINAVAILAKAMRPDIDLDTKGLTSDDATENLSDVSDPEKSAFGNGAFTQFTKEYFQPGSPYLRKNLPALNFSAWLLVGISITSVLFTKQIMEQVILCLVVYAFSAIIFLSINMMEVFGTKGSQIRVSEKVEELLNKLKD